MSNGEGGLRAPVREIVAWQEEDYWNKEKLDEETRRQFDVCHGCRTVSYTHLTLPTKA